MFYINYATVGGNLTRDPELLTTKNGTIYCKVGLATNRSVKKPDETYEDVPTFHNIVIWNKPAEWFAKNVKKGASVTFVGRIENRTYDKEDGTKGYTSEIIADNFVVGRTKSTAPEPTEPTAVDKKPSGVDGLTNQEAAQVFNQPVNHDDDMPF